MHQCLSESLSICICVRIVRARYTEYLSVCPLTRIDIVVVTSWGCPIRRPNVSAHCLSASNYEVAAASKKLIHEAGGARNHRKTDPARLRKRI